MNRKIKKIKSSLRKSKMNKIKQVNKLDKYSNYIMRIINDPYVIPSVPNDAQPELYNIARLAGIKLMYDNAKMTEPKSRITLFDYLDKEIKMVGIIADIIYNEKKGYARILLNYPMILKTDRGTIYDLVEIDSHIWIRTKDIVSCQKEMCLGIGDLIICNAKVKTYKGLVTSDMKKGYKLGLNNIDVLNGGIIAQTNEQKRKDIIDLENMKSDYPKDNDYVIKFYDINNGKFKMALKDSCYPHHNELIGNDEALKQLNEDLNTKINNMLLKYSPMRNPNNPTLVRLNPKEE